MIVWDGWLKGKDPIAVYIPVDRKWWWGYVDGGDGHVTLMGWRWGYVDRGDGQVTWQGWRSGYIDMKWCVCCCVDREQSRDWPSLRRRENRFCKYERSVSSTRTSIRKSLHSKLSISTSNPTNCSTSKVLRGKFCHRNDRSHSLTTFLNMLFLRSCSHSVALVLWITLAFLHSNLYVIGFHSLIVNLSAVAFSNTDSVFPYAYDVAVRSGLACCCLKIINARPAQVSLLRNFLHHRA